MKAQKPKRLTRAELSALKQTAGINIRQGEEEGITDDMSFVGSYELYLLVAEVEAHRAAERAARKARRGKR